MSDLTPGFIVAHSHKLESLTEVAVQLVSQYPVAPLQEETILVQSNGIAQWLKAELAHSTGIATMLDISLPARFVWKAYRSVLGNQIPTTSPYDKDRLVWRLLRILPILMQQNANFASLREYVSPDPDQRKIFQLCEKIADLLDQYQVYRADWLDLWSRGLNQVRTQRGDIPLSDDQVWQAELWRTLIDDIGSSDLWSNRAALHQAFLQKAAELTVRPPDLPPRVIVFGISSLPQQTLEVLNAVKGYTQVLLCVHNPAKHYWADIVDGRELFRQDMRARQQRKNTTTFSMDELHQHAHPLLASWGKQGRDYIRLLDLFDETRQKEASFGDLHFDIFDEDEPQNLLQQLQNDVLNLRPLAETRERWPCPAAQDRSIVFHNCHSPQREVEVLHDQLLAAFAQDPDLKPRDIMVMVPDINKYAPHIEATFGRFDAADERTIPYTIADQGMRHRQPLLIALEMLLSAPDSRFKSSDIFDLLHVPAVQRKFAFTAHGVEQLQQWTQQAGARWGLHGLHRQSLGFNASFTENSWRFALNRMLYGYATGETGSGDWNNLEPYPEVAGMDAVYAGGLAALLERLEHYWQQLAEPLNAEQWHAILNAVLDDFFAADTDAETLLLTKLRSRLDEWLAATEEAQFSESLRYNIVRELWLSSMDEGGLNQRFMAGAVNFATLMPMRAIPFKRVCLLGMNDSDYPRSTQRPDFDLMAQDYRPGDRSRREDDRYLFLEALLSARQQFYVSWVGQSSRDNSPIPPSVLVGQLQDHLVAGWQKNDEPILQSLVTQHFLQPFSASYFISSDVDSRYFTFAREWQNIHRNGQQNSKNIQLPTFVQEAPLTVRSLTDTLREPAKLFMQQRLGVFLPDYENALPDDEPFSLDGFAVWQLNKEVLDELVAANERDDLAVAEAVDQVISRCFSRIGRRGALPVGEAAEQVISQCQGMIREIFDSYRGYRSTVQQALEPMAIDTELQGLHISDSCRHLYQPVDNDNLTQLLITPSKVMKRTQRRTTYHYRNLLEPWVRHLLLCSTTGRRVQTVIVGQGGAVVLRALEAEEAHPVLQDIMSLTWQALREPLPVAAGPGISWLELTPEERNETKLALLYEGSAFSDGQRKYAPYLARFYPDANSLLADGRLQELALALYQPLMQHLAVEEHSA